MVSVPALSLSLPAVAVVVANTGGKSDPVRISADIERFLLFYSGVFALVALTAAVGAGLLATDRIVMTADRRILAQGLHRMISLVGVSALANHIMLEVVAHRVSLTDGFVPFMAVRRTFFMGLGTLASDLFIVIIVTGLLRSRFTSTSFRRWMWRVLHVTSYAAWPLAILHGLLAGRSAKPYVDWSYGACLAAVALALTLRLVLQGRGRNGAEGMPVRRPQPPVPAQPSVAPSFTPLPGPYSRPSGPHPRTARPQPAPDMRLPARRVVPRPPQRRQLPALPAAARAPMPRPRHQQAPSWPLPDDDGDPASWLYDGRDH